MSSKAVTLPTGSVATPCERFRPEIATASAGVQSKHTESPVVVSLLRKIKASCRSANHFGFAKTRNSKSTAVSCRTAMGGLLSTSPSAKRAFLRDAARLVARLRAACLTQSKYNFAGWRQPRHWPELA